MSMAGDGVLPRVRTAEGYPTAEAVAMAQEYMASALAGLGCWCRDQHLEHLCRLRLCRRACSPKGEHCAAARPAGSCLVTITFSMHEAGSMDSIVD